MANASAFAGIPVEIIVRIFNKLPFATKRTVLPLVCKGWQQLVAGTPELWGTVTLCGIEERAAFSALARAGLTGGLQLTYIGAGRPVVKMAPIVRWFQKHPAQVSTLRALYCPPATLTDFNLKYGVGSLSLLLVTMKDSLRKLEVGNSAWIEGDGSFSAVAWLTNLTSLTVTISKVRPEITPMDFETLGGLTMLKKLQLQSQEPRPISLQEFPASFFEPTRLKSLVIECFKVQPFPERLVGLSNLTELILWRLGDFSVPQWSAALSDLVGIRRLALDLGPTVLLLPNLGLLRRLQYLEFKGSMMARLPVEQLWAWHSLEKVVFKNCELMRIPERVVVLARLPALRQLAFPGCKLCPDGVRALMLLVDALRGLVPDRTVVIGSKGDTERDIANDRAQGIYPPRGYFEIRL